MSEKKKIIIIIRNKKDKKNKIKEEKRVWLVRERRIDKVNSESNKILGYVW